MSLTKAVLNIPCVIISDDKDSDDESILTIGSSKWT